MSAALHAAETLARLAEEGCALAAEGRLESLEAQEPAWRAAVDALRAAGEPGPQALALVRRAAALQGEQEAILTAARAQAAAELGRLHRTRAGARGYAGAGLEQPAGGLRATA